jgi:hypothetical protein
MPLIAALVSQSWEDSSRTNGSQLPGLARGDAGVHSPRADSDVRILIPEAQIREQERAAQMQADILVRLAAIPGVTAAAFASGLPMELEYHNGNVIAVEGKTPLDQIPLTGQPSISRQASLRRKVPD